MAALKQRLEDLALRAVSRTNTGDGVIETYSHRVFGGPLRGSRLSVARLERLSYALGTFESAVVAVLQQHLRPGAVAYDVGANAGYLSLVMAAIVGPDGQVFSFEPDPKNLRALSLNASRVSSHTVTVVDRAVSNRSETVEFAAYDYSLVGHINTGGAADDADLMSVEAVSLDDFVLKDGHPVPSLIKIDIEGGEAAAIEGAAGVIEQHRPVVLCEVRAGDTMDRIMSLFEQHDYRGEAISGSDWNLETDGLCDMVFVPQPQ